LLLRDAYEIPFDTILNDPFSLQLSRDVIIANTTPSPAHRKIRLLVVLRLERTHPAFVSLARQSIIDPCGVLKSELDKNER
jgi:hypothetical protein